MDDCQYISSQGAVEQADAVVRLGKLPVKKLSAKPFPGYPTVSDRATASFRLYRAGNRDIVTYVTLNLPGCGYGEFRFRPTQKRPIPFGERLSEIPRYHAHHIHIRYKMGQVGTHAASAVRSCNIWECDRIRYNQKFSHPSRINSLIIGPVVRRCTAECDICVALTGTHALRFSLHGPE